ncbi:hypothetical protein [Luteimonas huabeiensis]|uniref:hypothetical protein n=1 Tax=Luteimonas huabeiensis TaxID=1244513 RepID=UPI0004653070|nr:hypothetical protein [Luteimonas huabeiensis]
MNRHDAPAPPAVITGPQLYALYARELRDLYPGRAWHEVEPILYRVWQRRPGNDWASARAQVREFWRRG